MLGQELAIFLVLVRKVNLLHCSKNNKTTVIKSGLTFYAYLGRSEYEEEVGMFSVLRRVLVIVSGLEGKQPAKPKHKDHESALQQPPGTASKSAP